MVVLWQEGIRARYHDPLKGMSMPASTGDGHYGTATRNYTRFWQAEIHNLSPAVVADGVVGANTWNAARLLFVTPLWRVGNWEAWLWKDTSTYPDMNAPVMFHYIPYDLWQITPITCQESTYAHNITRPDLPITVLDPYCTP